MHVEKGTIFGSDKNDGYRESELHVFERSKERGVFASAFEPSPLPLSLDLIARFPPFCVACCFEKPPQKDTNKTFSFHQYSMAFASICMLTPRKFPTKTTRSPHSHAKALLQHACTLLRCMEHTGTSHPPVFSLHLFPVQFRVCFCWSLAHIHHNFEGALLPESLLLAVCDLQHEDFSPFPRCSL